GGQVFSKKRVFEFLDHLLHLMYSNRARARTADDFLKTFAIVDSQNADILEAMNSQGPLENPPFTLNVELSGNGSRFYVSLPPDILAGSEVLERFRRRVISGAFDAAMTQSDRDGGMDVLAERFNRDVKNRPSLELMQKTTEEARVAIGDF